MSENAGGRNGEKYRKGNKAVTKLADHHSVGPGYAATTRY